MFFSPTVMADLPFGEKKVTSSSGVRYSIPNSLRIQQAAEIVFMFKSMMEESGLKKMLMGTSTMYRILSFCSATKRSASICVDYYYSEAETVST